MIPLLVVLVGAAVLRFYRIDAQSLWYDEGISAFQLTRDYAEIVRAAAGDTHPPLYYWALKAWGGLFGATEFGLRSLSAVCGVAGVGLTWLLGRRLFGSTMAAIIAAALVALSPLAVYYAQEVRMYTLVVALGLTAAWGYVTRRWAVYAIAALATLYTQYLGVALLAAINLHALIYLLVTFWRSDERRGLERMADGETDDLAHGSVEGDGRRAAGGRWGGGSAAHGRVEGGARQAIGDRRGGETDGVTRGRVEGEGSGKAGGRHFGQWRGERRPWLLANAAVVLGFMPWLPVFVEQSTQRGLNVSPRTPDTLLVRTLAGYGGGLDERTLAVAAGSLLVGLAVVGLPGGASGRRREGTLLAALLWLVPLALVIGLGLRSGLFELRYLLLGVPGMALLTGYGLASFHEWIERLALARVGRGRRLGLALTTLVLIALFLAPLPSLAKQYFDPALARDDYRAAVRDIERNLEPGDGIILSAPNQVEVWSFYDREGRLDAPVYPLPAQRPIDIADTRARLEAIGAQHARVWLVSWAMGQADPGGVIQEWLLQNGFPASHHWYGTLQVELIALDEPTISERLEVRLDNGIELEQFRVSSWTAAPGDTIALTLVWRAHKVPRERWKVFTQILSEEPRVVAQRDAEPGGDTHPTTTWHEGEVFEDHYGITLPEDLAPGTYRLVVGMYRNDRRARTPDGVDAVILGEVTVR